MRIVLQLFVLGILVPRCISSASSSLSSDLQSYIDAASAQINGSVSVAIRASSIRSLALASGFVDSDQKTPATTSDKYAWGSVTKTFTGAAILKLVQQGSLSLDDRVHQFVDPVLRDSNYAYATMQELFSTDRWVNVPSTGPKYNASDITIRHLLSMRSGVPDYDSDAFRHIQYAHGDVDFSPADLLDWVHGPLQFSPGQIPPESAAAMQPGYSSMNFVLLGYVLCYFEGVTDWTQYSQASIVPTDINGIHFANAGPFREHLSPVHGYDRFSFASRHGEFDVSDVSAGGGWTGGNVIMSPSSAAEWIFALYGPGGRVLSHKIARQMVPRAGTPGNGYYGLATMNLTGLFGGGTGSPRDWSSYGHMGDTYGFSGIAAYISGVDVFEDMAISFGSNVEGAQFSLLGAMCKVYNRILDEIKNTTVRDCAYRMPPSGQFAPGSCNCN